MKYDLNHNKNYGTFKTSFIVKINEEKKSLEQKKYDKTILLLQNMQQELKEFDLDETSEEIEEDLSPMVMKKQTL